MTANAHDLGYIVKAILFPIKTGFQGQMVFISRLSHIAEFI